MQVNGRLLSGLCVVCGCVGVWTPPPLPLCFVFGVTSKETSICFVSLDGTEAHKGETRKRIYIPPYRTDGTLSFRVGSFLFCPHAHVVLASGRGRMISAALLQKKQRTKTVSHLHCDSFHFNRAKTQNSLAKPKRLNRICKPTNT